MLPLRVGAFGIWFIWISGALFAWYVPNFELKHGLPVLDLEGPFWPPKDLMVLFAYDASAVGDYLRFLVIDCVFALSGALFLRAVISALTTADRDAPWRAKLLLLPVVPAVADILENGSFGAIAQDPNLASGALPWVAAALSWTKHATLLMSFAVAVWLGLRWYRGRRLSYLAHDA